MTLRHTFIENLKYYRKQKGFTQEKLAEAIGMSTSYIGDMEARERFPSPETIDKIADALSMETSLLLNERGSPANIQNTFVHIYGNTLQEELKTEIYKAIEKVCNRIR